MPVMDRQTCPWGGCMGWGWLGLYTDRETDRLQADRRIENRRHTCNIHIYIYMYACIYIYMHLYAACTCVYYVYVYTHIYIMYITYMHTYTYIHAHTHTYIYRVPCRHILAQIHELHESVYSIYCE